MSFAALEKELKELPAELQNNIEMYALFVINTFKHSSANATKKQSASKIIENLTGIISNPTPLTMNDIRSERISV